MSKPGGGSGTPKRPGVVTKFGTNWLLRGRPGCDVKAVVGILTIATPSPPPKHGHLVGNMRSPESLPEPTLPGLASPEPPGALHALFLATGGTGLLVALRLALRRPGSAGRCIWHRHHLLSVRALPGSGPKYISGCSWRRPWTPDRHLFVLASSAEEEGWACGAPGAWGSLSLYEGPPPSKVWARGLHFTVGKTQKIPP